MLISEELRTLREKFLLTQEEFAKELGFATSTVTRWETGRVRPNISAMKVIKNFCEKRNYPYEEVEKAWLNH